MFSIFKAARFGQCFQSVEDMGPVAGAEDSSQEGQVTPLSSHQWGMTLRVLRLLNTLRSSQVGLPLTYIEFIKDLGFPGIIDKYTPYRFRLSTAL